MAPLRFTTLYLRQRAHPRAIIIYGHTSYAFDKGLPFYDFAYDFAPGANSCALDAASSDYVNGASTDITGAFRTQGTALDIGCFEVHAETSIIVASLSIEPSYRNISYTATITSRGSSMATTATATLIISPNADMSDAIISNQLFTATADGDSENGTIDEVLSPNTEYWTCLLIENNLGDILLTDSIQFMTSSEDATLTCVLDSNLVAPAIIANVESLGRYASSVDSISARLWDSPDRSGTPIAIVTKEVSVDIAQKQVLGISFSSAHGLIGGNTYYIDVVAIDNLGNTSKPSNIVEFTVPTSGENVWANNTADMSLASSYVFNWVPNASDKLYFESPAVVQPEVVGEITAPELWFAIKGADTVAKLAGYEDILPRDYNIGGSGTLIFSASTIVTVAIPEVTNRISAAVKISKNALVSLKLAPDFTFAGEISYVQGSSVTKFEIFNSDAGGKLHFAGASQNFDKELKISGNVEIFFDHPQAMTSVTKLTIAEGNGQTVRLINTTDDTLFFENATLQGNYDWRSAGFVMNGSPFKIRDISFMCRNTAPEINADLEIEDLFIDQNSQNTRYDFKKTGTGLFEVTGNVSYINKATLPISGISLLNGCLAFTNPEFVEPFGYLFIDFSNNNIKGTIGLAQDYKPLLSGANNLTVYAKLHNVDWGFTAFERDIEVCIGNDASINVASKPSSQDNLKFTSSTIVRDSNALNTYYAVPRFWVFGYASPKANHTVLFKNRIEYDSSMNENVSTYVQSFGHTVAARLQGTLQTANSDRRWEFNGNNVGGYIAVEADNSAFVGRMAANNKAQLLVNGTQACRSMAVDAGSGIGGTGTLNITEGLTIAEGGALFGGEYGKGGSLKVSGALTMNEGSILRVEIPDGAEPSIGCVELTNQNTGKTLTINGPVAVRLDVTAAKDNKSSNRVKILDWSGAQYKNGTKPELSQFVLEDNVENIRRASLRVEDDALYLRYMLTNMPVPTTIMIK